MTDDPKPPWTRTSVIVKAPPEAVWAAFMEPAILIEWLPPADMTSKLHSFDGRVGGGYRMSLYYAPDETAFAGKTGDKEDVVEVRFTALEPPHRLVEAIDFVTDDPALKGTMTMTATLEPVAEGTRVTMLFEKLPPGLNPKDNDDGARMSLDQLAARFA